MQKYVRLVLVVSICCFIAISLIPTRALKVKQYQSPAAEDNKNTLSIKTHTMSDSIIVELFFPQPTIIDSQNYHSVEMQDLLRFGAPGEPVLPFKTIKVLIPQGKEFQRIDVAHGNKKLLEGKFNVEYGKTAIPISSKTSIADRQNQEIYSSSDPFPSALFSQASEQYVRGYRILLLTLHPVQYIPKTGELSYFETMTVTINLKETSKTSPWLRNLPKDRMTVQEIADNPEAAETYTITTTQLRPLSVNSSESYDYVIITDSTLNSSFQPLIDWKILKGLNATTVLVEDILSDPDYYGNGLFGDGSQFNDTAARIRNFIRDAYYNWETEYVLLGGDIGIIPKRGTYGFVATDPITVDYSIPCDMYYGALDGSWDNDNDTIFGEGVYSEGSESPQNGTAGEEADFFAEVYIGRAPVTSPVQVENFVNKTLWYEQASDDSYFRKAVMIGEKLDDETQGANSKDLVSDEIPQYTTTRLYERDGSYSRSAVIDAINSGTHILNHDGHTNPDIMMELTRDDVDTLITNTEYFFGYSIGCHAAAFDGDSVIEHFIYNPHGAFAFVGNSRYGWYSPGTTFGTGDQFDRAFFNVLNNTVRNLGKTLQFSKEGFAGSTSNSVRWTYFELNLLGDPETELVTEIMAPTAHFQTNPTAERLSPPILLGVVNITGVARRGTAAGTTFSNFTIEFYRSGQWHSDGISLLNNGHDETTNDMLAIWDTNVVSPGTVDLRLTVKDENGTIGEDRWRVRVEELPAIRVLPKLTETQEGLTFTVSVMITDPVNLFGLDFHMSWNTTLVDYVSHALYIPVEDYWWGILYSPVTITKDNVNQTAGTYWVAAESTSSTPFNKDGTVFDMTFQAIATGACNLEIYSTNLTEKDGTPITHKIADGVVEIAPGVHDVAVTGISLVDTVVGEEYQARIRVTVANEGTYAENFNITVYANGTLINTTQIALSPLNSTTITVIWDTTGWMKGNYTISANATSVLGETDMADNTMVNGTIIITIVGDVDGDRDVDIYDIVRMAGIYGVSQPDPRYDPNCDIDGDGDIDIYDIVAAAGNYGQGT
ncbi:MAG: C25 family cysteine peptidase [Candidatus Bathyarchaeota archaeon]|nr:C25 family cysteine peptidase [Candidatus Bathyarchaeota archaeon]